MPVNRDKTHLWKADTAKSVDLFNTWFMASAPKAFRETRITAIKDVESTLTATSDFSAITPQILRDRPGVLPTLRMACCPPLAVDRLIGLANAKKNLVGNMEKGKLPPRMPEAEVTVNLNRMIAIVDQLLDRDIFPWLAGKNTPTTEVRHRAATIVADRLCNAVANPIIRNAQEQRQLAMIEKFLIAKRYRKKQHSAGLPLTDMESGTFSFRMILLVGEAPRPVRIPIDAVIQPHKLRQSRLPILVEAKSAGDFTNTNKRQKEEATKAHQLRAKFGNDVEFILFLCGYFDAGYLGYEAAELIDWVWEHRVEDLGQFGI
ncbi:MAG: XamI family restriction endonuclease [Planctomycetaceae bacterium]|nr:XamI family restriction endonuclease [Planctomycetaceae bacterium]